MLRQSAVLLVLMLALAGCNGAEETTADPTPTPASGAADSDADDGDAVTITAVDYAFNDVPSTIDVGTELTLVNRGDEPHEIVLFHIPPEEERTIEELLALPEEEEPPVEFKGVVIAMSNSDEAMTPEGPAVVDEPGRYALVCFFPVGLTDADLQEAIEQMEEGAEGPPPLPEGPPHFTQGMWSEFDAQ